jgi:hypothetical protein
VSGVLTKDRSPLRYRKIPEAGILIRKQFSEKKGNNMALSTGLRQIMSDRQAISDYLADLPQLDRQVLFQWFAKKEGIRTIASNLQISATHVEHIVQRTDEFRRGLANRGLIAA